MSIGTAVLCETGELAFISWKLSLNTQTNFQ